MNSQLKDHKVAVANSHMIERVEETNHEANKGQKLEEAVNWLNSMFPLLKIPMDASEEELRVILNDGTVLCNILNRTTPGFVLESQVSSAEQRLENVVKFLGALEEMGLRRFRPSDLEQMFVAERDFRDIFHFMDLTLADQMTFNSPRDSASGSMAVVVECLLNLRDHLNSDKCGSQLRKRWKSEAENFEGTGGVQGDPAKRRQYSLLWGEERRRSFSEKFQRVARNPRSSEQSTATSHHVGHKFHEVFQLKQGRYSDLPAAKISEMLKSNSLDNAPTQSLLSVVNGILDESVERKNGEIPQRVACLLRRVIQEIERRISTQAEHIRNQNNLIKAREEKYQSRIRVLETLATGTSEETQIVMNQLQQIKVEKIKMEERKKLEEQDVVRLAKEKENSDLVINRLAKEKENSDLVINRLAKEKENSDLVINALKDEVEITKKTYEQRCTQLEQEAKNAKMELEEARKANMALEESKNSKMELEKVKKDKLAFEERLKGVEYLLEEARNWNKELEAVSASTIQRWRNKEHSYQNFIGFQLHALQELRVASGSIKREVISSQKSWQEEFNSLGGKLKGLEEVVQNYHIVFAENRRLYNEVQDLRGNIRVYCRIRPFLHGETRKQTTVEYVGENGELVISNPSKQGKDGHRTFKFDKVFGPSACQEKVFLDTQPLIRSVLDGYNVCIFAYGQTGSGKTYTMTGPEASSEEEWGVNYRALNDLFHISRSRRSTFLYEVGVQMVEIYNEQVRDLLTNDSSLKKLGIVSTSQSNGLAVPDASMHPVESTRDVIQLMESGHRNRSVGATALNQRSSRSHSIVTVHVWGTDLETSAVFRGSLHLVDLAGSERVDRSEVIGDRLKEAQHINKSLSALGDVIFALAQKSPHVPYRNSKLTQVLQSSLGGQAKTLMFVQLNPNVDSYSESMSTLKFAERVSGVELGAARSNKEGKDVRELMDQVASLKDTIARKDEEIEQLQVLKGAQSLGVGSDNKNGGLTKRGVSSPSKPSSLGMPARRSRNLSSGRATAHSDRSASDPDNCSENSDKHSEASSHQSLDDLRPHQKLNGVETGQSFPTDVELLGFGRVDSEGKLSDTSDGSLSIGTETDGSLGSAVDYAISPEGGAERTNTEPKSKVSAQIPRPPQKLMQPSSIRPPSKVISKTLTSSSRKATVNNDTSSASKIPLTTSATTSSSRKVVGSTNTSTIPSRKVASTSPSVTSSTKVISTSPPPTTGSSNKASSKRWQ